MHDIPMLDASAGPVLPFAKRLQENNGRFCLRIESFLAASAVFFLALVFSTAFVFIAYGSYVRTLGWVILLIGFALALRSRYLPRQGVFIFMSVFFFLALALRLLWATFSGTPQTSDFGFFVSLVPKIARGEFILLPYKQTGPSLVGAFFFLFFGEGYLRPTLLFQSILSGGAVLSVAYVSYRFAGLGSAIASGLFLAFSPEVILYGNLLNCETFQMSLLIGGWALIVHGFHTRSVWSAPVGGILVGLSQYMRGTGILYFAVFIWVAAVHANRPSWKPILLTSVGFLLPIASIVFFNVRDIGKPSFSPSQNAGMVFYIGTNQKSNGAYYPESLDEVTNELERQKATGEFVGQVTIYDIYDTAYHLAWRRIGENPFAYLFLMLKKSIFFWLEPSGLTWSLQGSRVTTSILSLERIAFGFHRLMLFFAVAGMVSLLFTKVSRLLDGFRTAFLSFIDDFHSYGDGSAITLSPVSYSICMFACRTWTHSIRCLFGKSSGAVQGSATTITYSDMTSR